MAALENLHHCSVDRWSPEQTQALAEHIHQHAVMDATSEDIRTVRDEVLLSLSLVSQLCTEGEAECQLIIGKSGLFADLLVLMQWSDQMVSRSCARVLSQWLRMASITNMNGKLSELIRLILEDKTSDQGKMHSLDVLGQLMSSHKRQTGGDCFGNLLQERKTTCFQQLMPRWTNILQLYLPRSKDESEPAQQNQLPLYAFLSLWVKLVKFYHQNRDAMPPGHDEGCVVDSCKELVEDLSAGRVPAVCFSRALDVVDKCLPYASLATLTVPVPEIYLDVSLAVTKYATDGGFFHAVPIVCGEEHFGCVPGECYCRGSLDGIPHTPSWIALRKLTLSCLSACATLLKQLSNWKVPAEASDGQLSARVLQCLQHLGGQAAAAVDEAERRWWPCVLFADQDDYLCLALLCLLDARAAATNLPDQKMTTFLDTHCNIHLSFLHLLESTSWDSCVLLDFLTSPETCFLSLFVKYLKFIGREWTMFSAACVQFDSLRNLASNYKRKSSDLEIKCSNKVLDGKEIPDSEKDTCGSPDSCVMSASLEFHSKNTDCAPYTEEYGPRAKDSPHRCPTSTRCSSDRAADVLTTGTTNIVIASSCAHATMVNKSESPDSKVTGELGSTLGGLQQLQQYSGSDPDSDRSGDETVHIIPVCGVQGNALVSKSGSHGDGLKSGENMGGDRTIDFDFVNRAFPQSKTLENVMTDFIRLRMAVENLSQSDLFPYNVRPLLRLLQRCEDLYEST